jgi:phosphoglycerol geranylgeranyltransferase
MGKTLKYLHEKIEDDGALLFYLIDPADNTSEENAKKGIRAAKLGADIILIGGSVGAQGEILDDTIKMIKEKTDIPVILFPGNIATISKYADAIYFMNLLNSRDTYWLSTAQMCSAPVVARYGLEPIPTTYLVAEPGMAVGWVGDARLLPRNKPYIAQMCALAGQYLGSKLVVIDSGSGAPEPLPETIISAVKKVLDVPLIIGGGIRTPEQAYKTIISGADCIQVGTVFEKNNSDEFVKRFVETVKKAGKEKKQIYEK